MKKILLILLFTITTGLVAQAQFASGLKAGASSSGVHVKDAKNNLLQFEDEGNITGFHVGAFARAKVSGFFLQPEAYFSTTGGKLQRKDINTNNVEEIKARFNRLDVPILLGYNLLSFVRVQAGPVASVLVNGKFGDSKLDSYLNNADWGVQAGIGIDISSFSADLRYERIKRDYSDQSTSFGIVNQQVLLSLGYKLLGK